jgi:hypothetical protein
MGMVAGRSSDPSLFFSLPIFGRLARTEQAARLARVPSALPDRIHFQATRALLATTHARHRTTAATNHAYGRHELVQWMGRQDASSPPPLPKNPILGRS